jgi:hypothetical protein
MVLEVGPDAGQVLDHGDVETLEQITRADAAQLEDLGRVDGARREDDFLLSRD